MKTSRRLRQWLYNQGMKRTPCPDVAQGDDLGTTASERFTEAARRIFSVTKTQLEQAEAVVPKSDKPRRAGRQKAKTA